MENITLNGLKETIYYTKVQDMLPVYIWKNEKVSGVFSALCVKYGSIHRQFKLENDTKYKQVKSGIAHFIEHLKFYESDNTTATDFYSNLGSDVNAFTTFDYTCYHVYNTSETSKNLNHLLDFVLTPYFTKKNLSKEKKIIIEEARADLDLPDTKLYFTHYADIFHKYKYSELITGTVEDIKATTVNDINLIFDTFYHPQNMFLVVTGNVNPYEIEALVEENLKNKDFKEYLKPKLKKYKEPLSVVNNYTEITGNVETSKVKISLKTPLSNFKGIDDVELRLIVSLIISANFGPTSDLKEELLEEELVSTISGGRSFIGDFLIITVNIETDYPKEAIKRVKESLENLYMTEEVMKRKINSSIASLVLNYDDIMNVNSLIQEDILSFDKIIDDVKVHLENINIEEINKVIKKIDKENMAITVLNKENK